MLTANYHCFFHPKTTAAWNFMPKVIKFNIYYNPPEKDHFMKFSKIVFYKLNHALQ